MRHIALVRHGETVGESSIRYHGSNDVALAEAGRQQVAGLLPLLRGELGPGGEPGVDWGQATVICSPLSRALASAEVLVDGLGAAAGGIIQEEGFREICFGRFEGMTAGEIELADPDWHAAWRRGETDAWPDGDSVREFGERVDSTWQRVLADHPGDLLVVVHRGVVRFGLRRLLAMASDTPDDFHVALGSVSIVAQPRAPGSANLLAYDRTA